MWNFTYQWILRDTVVALHAYLTSSPYMPLGAILALEVSVGHDQRASFRKGVDRPGLGVTRTQAWLTRIWKS